LLIHFVLKAELKMFPRDLEFLQALVSRDEFVPLSERFGLRLGLP
jgi:hypothetical protein